MVIRYQCILDDNRGNGRLSTHQLCNRMQRPPTFLRLGAIIDQAGYALYNAAYFFIFYWQHRAWAARARQVFSLVLELHVISLTLP